ncbi:hypothetical protein P7L78_09570 [Tistrella bauzanensis]|uniref:Uncharacterized protein n=1 Tax=Tistrella arctica TaxID=3133430 RepID=A0ABU9YNA7_9PROT
MTCRRWTTLATMAMVAGLSPFMAASAMAATSLDLTTAEATGVDMLVTVAAGLLADRLGGAVGELAGAAVMVAGAWALGRIASWAGVARDDRVRAYLETALERAVDRALGQPGVMPGAGPAGGDIADAAATYLRATVPDALRRLKIGPDAVERMVEARLARRLTAGGQPSGTAGAGDQP